MKVKENKLKEYFKEGSTNRIDLSLIELERKLNQGGSMRFNEGSSYARIAKGKSDFSEEVVKVKKDLISKVYFGDSKLKVFNEEKIENWFGYEDNHKRFFLLLKHDFGNDHWKYFYAREVLAKISYGKFYQIEYLQNKTDEELAYMFWGPDYLGGDTEIIMCEILIRMYLRGHVIATINFCLGNWDWKEFRKLFESGQTGPMYEWEQELLELRPFAQNRIAVAEDLRMKAEIKAEEIAKKKARKAKQQ